MAENIFTKPVMVITGTSKGIGKYLAEYYLNKNFIVIGCSRSEGSINNENYRHYCLDVADEIEVKRLFREVRKDFKRLDVLINNAAVASTNHSLLTPLSTLKRTFDTNVAGMFLFSSEAGKAMRTTGGRIINFSSVAVALKLPGESVYAASKAAVNNFTKMLAAELADLQITVNAIGPTPMKTDFLKDVPEEKIDEVIAKLPVKRLGELEDVSNVTDFFLKPESNYITGQIIYLGGV